MDATRVVCRRVGTGEPAKRLFFRADKGAGRGVVEEPAVEAIIN